MSLDESDIEASRAPLLDHLIELRGRLIICAAALAVGFVICFFFATNIYIFLLAPFERAQGLLAVQKAAAGHTGPFDLWLTIAGLKSLSGVHVEPIHMVFTEPLEFFFTKLKLAGFGAVVLTFPTWPGSSIASSRQASTGASATPSCPSCWPRRCCS